MIPKIIHYCWFGGGEMNKDFEENLESWKKYQPDYEIKRWDETNFDLSDVPEYVKKAYDAECYAIVSDYARAKIIYENGGWYMDTDVEIKRPFFDDYLNNNFIAAIEGYAETLSSKQYKDTVDEDRRRNNGDDGFVHGIAIIMSVFGAEKNCKYLKDVVEFYSRLDFDRHDYKGCQFAGAPIGPQIFARCLEPYGFVYDCIEQHLEDNILILGPGKISPCDNDDYAKNGISSIVHKCTFSWFIKFLSNHPKSKVTTSKDGKKTTIRIMRGIFRRPNKFTLTKTE